MKLWKGHKYQMKAVARGLSKRFVAYFLDPGLGKTTIILKLYSILKMAGHVKGVLIVAPLRPAYLVWPKEVKKWRNFSHLTLTVLHSEWGLRNRAIKRKKDIYVINPEGLKWLTEYLRAIPKSSWPFDMLVVDESTKFKDINSVRFKYLKYIIPKMRRRYILTGTPTPHSLLDIQSQLAIVDMGETFGLTANAFIGKFFKRAPKKYPMQNPRHLPFIPRDEEHEERIYKKCSKFVVRMKGSDYLELPKRIDNKVWVRLPEKALKHYKEVEKTLFTKIDGKSVSAEQASSIVMKCHQMANGNVFADEDILAQRKKKAEREVIHLHEAKLDALEDLYEELGRKPLFIAYRFRHDLAALVKRFGKELVVMPSSMKACQKVEKDWNAGKIQLLAAYPGTSALGLNLQETGQDVVWYSLIDDFEAYDQFIKRLERQGSKYGHINNHLILAEDTVDLLKYNSLMNKDYKQLTFLDKVQRYGAENLLSV